MLLISILLLFPKITNNTVKKAGFLQLSLKIKTIGFAEQNAFVNGRDKLSQ